MQRDDDYLRALLMEADESEDFYIKATLHMSANKDQIKRHMDAELLCDAGFFEKINEGIYRVTNDGYEYLSVIRDDNIWKKTKFGAAKIGGATLEIMKELAIAYLKSEAKKKLGVYLS